MKIAFVVPDNRDEFKRYALPDPVFGPAPQALLNGFAQTGGCEIHVISLLKKRAATPQKLADNIFYHGLYLPFGAWFRTGYASAVLAMRRKIRQLKIDLVHAQGSERFAALVAATSGKPFLLTLHGVMQHLAKIEGAAWPVHARLSAAIEQYASKRADGVICLTSHSQRAVAGAARRTWIVPNATEDNFFEVVNRPSDPPELLCVGTIYPLKNQIGLIKALDPLAKQMAFRLTFLGSPVHAIEAEFAALLAERSWCRAEGFVDSDTLRKKLSTATMLVHPTFEDNCPMAILEAMAAGVPVAGSTAGGVPDLVQPNITGLLFDPNDAAAMRASVEQIICDKARAREFGENGRRVAEQKFRPRHVAERHLEIYRETIASLNKAPAGS